jgi:hypothetical protein
MPQRISSPDVQRIIENVLRRENQRLRAALPEEIAQEHSTGEDTLSDNFSLMSAYEQYVNKQAQNPPKP